MSMSEQQKLVGTIERILFQAPDTGFAVFVITTQEGQPVTTRGCLPAVHAGEIITVTGSWVNHPKFGRQFEAKSCTTDAPTTVAGLKKYLASGMIKGIGPVYAHRLVEHFGAQVLEVINNNPARLHEVPGIGQSRVQKIIAAWSDQKEIANVMVFLQDKGISATYAVKIYKKYGQQAIAILQENPYRLATEVWGIGFKIADQIAENIGIARDSLKRISACLIHAITTTIGNGHLYVELEELKATTRTLLALDPASTPDLEQRLTRSLHDLYEQRSVILISYQDTHYLTLPMHYFSEKGVANKIKELQQHAPITVFDHEALYTKLRFPQNENDVMLNEEQQHGIMTCFNNKITVITGGPGTGKTTLIKKLLQLLDAEKVSYKLAAPTGRAAKRITEGTGRQAVTIHRLLSFDFATHSFAHNEQNALKLSFLIIDEASMIDVFLAHALLKAVPLHAHVVFIGDIDQLPSVGAGNFLNDLIASATVPTIRLKHIFRQAQDSLIIVNAHRVNNGEFPITSLPNSKKDFIFIKENDPASITEHMKVFFGGLIQRYGINHDDAQVLVPMNRGIVGTHMLNEALQQIINPSTTLPHVTYGHTTFKVGDRVMQIRNNYDKLVFNGDMGPITALNADDKTLTVSYLGRDVVYESSEFDELVLAYAVTIHKSQGSEYSAVIIPIFMQHFTLLQRNLIYTAITRAKKLCILIGQPKAIGMALTNNKAVTRTTFLQQFLTTDLICR